MVNFTANNRILSSCLIILGLAISSSLHAINEHKLGEFTQMQGSATFLSYTPPSTLTNIEQDRSVKTAGSYLTQDETYMTVKFNDGSWMRVGPKTKFALEYLANERTILMHLFSGSVKILFSTTLNKGQTQKFIVKSGDSTFETSEAKFVLVRNTLIDSTNLYVEKGIVIAAQYNQNERVDSEIVHTKETITLRDKNSDVPPPEKMGDKLLRSLQTSFYPSKDKEN